MNMTKMITAIGAAFLLDAGFAHAQSISDPAPAETEKSDGLPGKSIDKDNDGVSEGRSFEGGPGGTEVTVEGHSETPTRDNPDGDTGATVGLKKDF